MKLNQHPKRRPALLPALLLAWLGVLAGAPAQNCVLIPSGAVAWWQAEGNAINTVGTNTISLGSGASYSPGKVGQAFNFNGASGAYITVQSSPSLNLTQDVTIEGWIKPTNNTARIVNKEYAGGTDYGLRIDGVGALAFTIPGITYWSTVSGDPSKFVPLNTFSHVAAVYDGATMVMYINGINVFQAGKTGPIQNNVPNNWRVGADLNGASLFTGLLDELTIYNRALSANEIQTIYNAGGAGKCSVNFPRLDSQPTNQTIRSGFNATFSVTASGPPPLFYQWFFNTTNVLTGQTNSSLVFMNVALTNAGKYFVVVSNSSGSAPSSNATLVVLDAFDTDRDGIPNYGELQYGLNPTN